MSGRADSRSISTVQGVLLDTHVALWLLTDHPALGPLSRELVETTPAWVSAAAVWEIGIKQSIGKLSVDGDLRSALVEAGVRELGVSWAHATAYRDADLPHRDPFDRMLVAQAGVERLRFLTADRKILESQPDLTLDARR